MPVASERMSVFVRLTHGYPFALGCSPVQASQVCIGTFSAHHATHSLALSKEGWGRHFCKLGSSSGVFPFRNPSTCGSNTSGHPRSSSSGCNQSVFPGAQKSSTSIGCDQSAVLWVVSTSEFELPSLKVTCLLGHMGVGESTCLLAASPVQPSA